jgi:hypothetical protein
MLDLKRRQRLGKLLLAETWCSMPIKRHAISSIYITFSTGTQVSTALMMRSP